MKIVFFTHPGFLRSNSMPRFTRLLADGMEERGHEIKLWSPKPFFFSIPAPELLKKWLGYIDQFIVFPAKVKKDLKACSTDTIFVFIDQALGPWVPLVSKRVHIIHCHDFLAQRSAFGEVPQNPVSWTGKTYQAMIRRGFRKGKNFISVSKKTREDLHEFLRVKPDFSEVVLNGLNFPFEALNPGEARKQLSEKINLELLSSYILHVGGNQWYKNRKGVIELYSAWREKYQVAIPLLLVGPEPNKKLIEEHSRNPYNENIHFLTGLDNREVNYAYSGASVFLFPSFAEGFGWPIAEAMASGCPVITTDEAPMNEVAGKAGFYISRRPSKEEDLNQWKDEASEVIHEVITLSSEERKSVIEAGLQNVRRFNSETTLDRIEVIYKEMIASRMKIIQ